jgi:hypothetical protein
MKQSDHDILIKVVNDIKWIKNIFTILVTSDFGQFIYHLFKP